MPLRAGGQSEALQRPKPVVFIAPGPPHRMAREAATLRERKPVKGYRSVWRPDAIFAVSDDLAEFANARAMLALADAAGEEGFQGEPVWSGEWSRESQQGLAQILGKFYPWSLGEDGLLHDVPMIVFLPRVTLDLQSAEGRSRLSLHHRGGNLRSGEEFRQRQETFLNKLRRHRLKRIKDPALARAEGARNLPEGSTVWFDGLTPLNEQASELRKQVVQVADILFAERKAEIQASLESRYASLFRAWPPGEAMAKLPIGAAADQLGAEEKKMI